MVSQCVLARPLTTPAAPIYRYDTKAEVGDGVATDEQTAVRGRMARAQEPSLIDKTTVAEDIEPLASEL